MTRCAALLLGAAGATAVAQAVQPVADARLVVTSTFERIAATPLDGSPADLQGVSATAASPAEQLIVSVKFSNVQDEVVDSVRITSPIPADLQYVPGSASGPGSEVLFSADNGRTFGRPQELIVVAPDRSTRAASSADYTHVRWVLRAPLDAGATGVARFRAVPR